MTKLGLHTNEIVCVEFKGEGGMKIRVGYVYGIILIDQDLNLEVVSQRGKNSNGIPSEHKADYSAIPLKKVVCMWRSSHQSKVLQLDTYSEA